jgi:hypothetical protein
MDVEVCADDVVAKLDGFLLSSLFVGSHDIDIDAAPV